VGAILPPQIEFKKNPTNLKSQGFRLSLLLSLADIIGFQGGNNCVYARYYKNHALAF
jgi:hypothetical protein